MEIWQVLQEELNRLYEMFVQRNPYFESNGGKVSIVAHSLGCVVTYDILTGWTQDVEHSWYNLQTRGGGPGPGGSVPSFFIFTGFSIGPSVFFDIAKTPTFYINYHPK
jgi:hypothetical protein